MGVRHYKGDIVRDVTDGVILQQVNCQFVMGKGLARQIYEKYPIVRESYLDLHRVQGVSPSEAFGKVQAVKVSDTLQVLNLFSQFDYAKSSTDTATYTSYEALTKCLIYINKNLPKSTPIYIPYGLGCGLANGDWDTVYALIKGTLGDREMVGIVHRG